MSKNGSSSRPKPPRAEDTCAVEPALKTTATATETSGNGKRLGGCTGRGWLPGQSGNAKGRARGTGFRQKIQALCGGEEYPTLAEALAAIAFGSPKDRKTIFGTPLRLTARDRLRAMEMLRDSGPGRPTQAIEFEAPNLRPVFGFTDDTKGVSAH